MSQEQINNIKRINAAANKNCAKDQSSTMTRVVLGASSVAACVTGLISIVKMAGL